MFIVDSLNLEPSNGLSVLFRRVHSQTICRSSAYRRDNRSGYSATIKLGQLTV